MKDLEKQLKKVFTETEKSEWSLVKFGEVVREVKETCSDPESEGLERVVGLEHLTPLDIHIRDWKSVSGGTTFTRVFRQGQVLFGRRRAYQRKAALAEFDGLCSGDIIVMEAIEGKLDQNLLPFIVHSDKFHDWAVSTSAGSLSPRTKFKHLAELEISLPPIEIQNELSRLMWKLEDLIEKNIKLEGKINTLFETLLQSLSSEDYCDKNLRLGDLIDLHYGKGLKESLRVSDGQFDVVTSAGIVGKHDQYIVEGPGLVVGRKGGIGNVVYVENNFWPIDTAYWVSKKEENMSLTFLYYLLRSAHLEKLSISTAIPGINRDDVLALKICLPNNEKIKWFENNLQETEHILEKYKANISSLNKLKTSIVNQII
jgi:type I restriction enzyme S subunit